MAVEIVEIGTALEQEVRRVYTQIPDFKRMRLSSVQRRAINRRLRVVYASIGADREQLIARAMRELEDAAGTVFYSLLSTLGEEPFLSAITENVVSLYTALHVKGEPDSKTQRVIREALRENPGRLQTLVVLIRVAANNAGTDFTLAVDALHTMQGLFHWYATKSMHAALNAPKNFLTWRLLQKAAPPKFTLDEWMRVNIIFSQFPELALPIAARQNMITVAGFTASMFEAIRDTIKTELYERAGGGLGAEALARSMLRDLTASSGAKLIDFPKDKYMLWARTEGCIIQNDALMELGDRAKMDGKIWQSLQDSKVRDGTHGPGDHVSNDADGAIPTSQQFSDGSSDGGTGSVSPYGCRCAVGPALLEYA